MVTVQRNINKLNEAHFMLYAQTQGFKYVEYQKEAECSLFGTETYIKMLDKLAQVYKILENNLDVNKDRIEFYFKPISDDYMSIFDYVMLSDYQYYNETLEANVKRVRNISEEERLIEYAKRVTEYYSQGNTEDFNRILTLSDLIKALDERELRDETKMAIINTYCNKNKYLDEIAEILSKTIAVLDEFCEENKFIEEFFYEYWSKYISNNDVIEMIEKGLNIEWKRNLNGIVIVPVLGIPNGITISIAEDDSGKEDILRIGILIDAHVKQRKKATNIDEIGNIMKVFSDKSKLDILNMIKDKSAYGKELADGLGLAKGTISHHMTSLMSIGVIDTLCESNKIYYSLNKKRFGEILDELKEYFTM